MRKLLILSFVLFLFSCQNEIETDRITTNLELNPKGLNPILYLAKGDNLVNDLLFLPLAGHNPVSLEYEPILAKSISSPIPSPTEEYPDAIKIDVELRDEARWDDGSEVTGEDIIFTLKTIFLPSINSDKYRAFSKDIFDATLNPDKPKAVSIYLKQLSINSVELATGYPIINKDFYDKKGILNKVSLPDLMNEEAFAQRSDNEALEEYGALFNSTTYSVDSISGCGAYKLKEWLSNQYVILEKKEGFWGEGIDFLEAKPNEIQMIITPDKAAAFTKLKAGIYDVYEGLTTTQWNELRASETYSSQYNFESIQLQRFYFFILNSRNKKMSDQAVRKALAHLVDLDSIIAVAENGEGERLNSPFLSIDKYSTLEDIPFEKEKARQILSAAGWNDSNDNDILDKEIDGELVELTLNCISTGSQLGQILIGVLTQNAKEVGIQIETDNVDRSIYQKRLKSHEFDLTLSVKGLSLMPYDPYNLFHTDNTNPGEPNYGNFGNEESDALIEEIRSTLDPEKRTELFLKLERILQEDQSYIFLYSPKNKMAIKKNVTGVTTVKLPGFDLATFEKIK